MSPSKQTKSKLLDLDSPFFKLTFLQKRKVAMGLRMALPKPRANPKEASQVSAPLKLADAGIAWKKLSDSEKEPFMEMARKDGERYQEEMREDIEALKEQEERRKARKRRVEGRERPKYISKATMRQRRHAANKKDPAAEKIRLDKLEEDIDSGKIQLENVRAKQTEGLSLIVVNAVKEITGGRTRTTTCR